MSEAMMTAAEIARLSEVTVAAVSNWRRRHGDFPQPTYRGGSEVYAALRVAQWLDTRKVATDDLKEDEPRSTTYGARFRKNAKLPAVSAHPEPQEVARSLFRAAGKFQGQTDIATHADLVLSLLHLWARRRDEWNELVVTNPLDIGSSADRMLWLDSSNLSRIPENVSKILTEPKQSAQVFGIIEALHHALRFGDEIDDLGRLDLAAHIFDKLLAEYAAAEGARGAEFFTPSYVVRLAVEFVAPIPGDKVLDPCCESGGFLSTAVEYMRQRGYRESEITVIGQAAGERTRWLTALNLDVHGIPVRLAPTPEIAVRENSHADKAFDVILSNPPFNMKLDTVGSQHDRWRYAPPPVTNANFAWLQYVVDSLSADGRASILMANGASSSANPRERAIRMAMVEDGAVEAIVALPSRLFIATGIPVTVWCLRSPRGKAADRILFIDARSLGTMINRTQRALLPTDIERIVSTYHKWRHREVNDHYRTEPGFAASASIDDIRRNQYRLTPGYYVGVGPSENLTSKDGLVSLVARTRELQQELDRLHARALEVDELVDSLVEKVPGWNH